MSPKLPRVTGREVIRALHRAGWYDHHQRGSHVYLKHPDRSGMVTVSEHAGETLKPKTLQSVLDQAGLTVEGLIQLL